MADLNFPSNPQANDTYTANSRSFKYDGSKWRYVTLSLVTVNSGSAITSLNNLSNSVQDFIVGASGSFFNISSSGSTHTFNIPIAGSGSTGLLTTLAQTIAGAKTFSSDLLVSSSTASINTTTGALSVTGGVGIGGSINVAGRINLWNSSNYTSFVSSATGNTVYTLPATSPATGSSVLQSTAAGVLSWVPMTASSSGTTSQNIVINSAGNANSFHPILLTPSPLSAGSAVSADTTIAFNPSTEILYVSGLAVTNTTASTSTTTGALIVTGGVGIGGSLNVTSASTISGVTINSGVITGNLTGTATTAGFATTSSYSLQAGYAITSGTASTAQNVYLGNNATSDLIHRLVVSRSTGAGVALSGASIFYVIPSENTLYVSGTVDAELVTALEFNAYSDIGSTSPTSGGLRVTGGVGIGGSVSVGGRLQMFNGSNYTAFVSSASGNTVYTLPTTSPATGSSVLQSTSAGVMSWVPMIASSSVAGSGTVAIPGAQYQIAGYYSGTGASVSGSTTFTNHTANAVVNISHTTNSNNPSSGALTVTGGVGIGQSVSVLGRLQLFNSSIYTAFVSSATGNTVYTLPPTSPATGSSVLQSTAAGVMSWVPMVAGSSSSGNTSQNVVINAAGNANVFHPVLFTPLQNSSGSAVSSDSTISFNPSTEILNVSGLAITSGTASTNTTTGALVVRGGLGVTGQLSFATASFGFTGITTNPTMSFIGATSSSPITLTVLTDNSLNWEGSQGSVFSIDSNLSTGEIFSVSDISGLPIISASAGQTVTFNEFGGYTQFGNGSINSSSTTTGALVVSGGVGITGNANIGGSVVLSSSTTSISTTTGALIVSNGVGIGGSLYVGSASRFTSSTASLNTSSGSLVVSGGVGIGGSINVGGASRFSDTTQTTSSNTGALIVNGGVGIGLSASIGGRLQLFNGSTYTAFVSAATANTVYTLPATSPAVGTSVLQSTSGGVLSWVSPSGFGNTSSGGIDGAVQYKSGSGFAGTSSFFYDTALLALRLSGFPLETPDGSSAALKVEQTSGSFNGSISGTMIAVNANSSFNGDLLNLQTNAITKFKVTASGAIGMSSSLTTAGDVSITSNTNSTSTTTGALQVRGGVGITGNAFIGGTTTVTNTTASVSSSSGALVVSGGVGIGQTLFIGGNLYQNTNAITAHSTGFRNRIINGDFNIDQRNSGATVVPSSTQNVTDRWKMNIFGAGRVTSGQNYGGVATPSPFVSYYGMKVTTTTTPGSSDYNFFSHVIEGPNINDLQWGNANAQTVTLSFWAYSSLTGTFGGSVRNFGGFNRSYPFTYTISSADTWEKKTVVIPGDTTGTWTVSTAAGIELIFIIANGSTFQSAPGAWAAGNFHGPTGSLANLIGTLNSTLYITGVQIELGTVATPFEKRNYGHEFSLCQRYYQITEVRVGGYHTTGGGLRGSAYLNTAMRPIASPVFTVLATDESANLGSLNADNSNFRGDSFRYIVFVTTTGDAYGQWKVSADCEF